MNKTKHFKRTAFNLSAKSMVSLLLLLIAMLMPQGAWADTHYDAGYGSTETTYSAAGIKFKVVYLRMYNYQGDNSHFNSNPLVTITAGGHTHTFNLGSLTGESGNSTFYYNGEGNENPYKGSGSFSKRTYEQTVDGIPVKAYFDNQRNEKSVSGSNNGGGSDKWCTADLTIEIGVQTAATVTIEGNWRDESGGINKTESYSWPFDIPKHTCNSDIQSATYLKSAATCTAAAVYYESCSWCGAAQSGTFTSGSALGHGSTGYTESYSWTGNAYNDASQDTKACTFTLTCKKCSTKVVNGASLTCTKTAHVDALCTATGSTTYQATGSYTAANSAYNYSATKTNVYTIAALDHSYGAGSWSWEDDGHSATCTRTCSHDANHKSSASVTLGNGITSEQQVAPNCTTKGTTRYTATATVEGTQYNATKDVVDIAALSHDYSQVVDEDYLVSAATCGSDAIYHEKCSRCDTHGAEWIAAGTAIGHDYTSHILTLVEDGLYAYACDNGCGTHTDDHIIKDFNGEGNHLELTKDGEGNYSTSEDITLADANGFVSPVDFTAASVTYNRNIVMDDGMYSFIVPFDIPADQAAELGKFYQYRTHGEGKVYFDDITTIDNADGIVRANTAYFFKPAKNITSITVENPTFGTTGTMADATNPSEPGLYGTYSLIDIPVGAYGYGNMGFFLKAGTDNKIKPFRAYLWLGSGASMAKALAFFGDYDVITGINNIETDTDLDMSKPIYTLSGQRIVIPKKGEIYIQNGKKVMKK